MVCPKPEDRINITEIKKHPWLKELTIFYGENNLEGKIDLNKKNGNINEKKKLSSPKKYKIKHLSHNPSFYKEEKKFEKKNDNNDNISNHSNHSDDSNQKNSKMNFQNCLEDNNMQKSLLKELEIKYLKEFISRKTNIDKILKEQEDDND